MPLCNCCMLSCSLNHIENRNVSLIVYIKCESITKITHFDYFAVYEEGMECIGVRDKLWIYYINSNCITEQLSEYDVWDAYIDCCGWTWDRYCT